MRHKLALMLLSGLLMVIPFYGACNVNEVVSGNQQKLLLAYSEHQMDCLSKEEVSSTIRLLSGTNSGSVRARELFFNTAGRSPKCREQAIASVMQAMDKPNLDISKD